MQREFKYDFNFETLVDTNAAPVAKSMRVIVSRCDHSLLEFESSVDCEQPEAVRKISVMFGISDSGNPTVAVFVSRRNPESRSAFDLLNEDRTIIDGEFIVEDDYRFVPSA